MGLGEFVLRLGASLVAWLVVHAHLVWLATLLALGCGPDGDQLWRLLLGSAPVAGGFSCLFGAVRAVPGLASSLRWLALPLVVLVPAGLVAAHDAFATATLGGRALCAEAPAALWERLWAPVQFGALAVIASMALRAWLAGAAERRSRG
jgi:hypothetical protein